MASACSVAVAIDSKNIGSDFLRTPAATTCILVTVSFVCTCFLVVCGVLVVREYSLATAYDSTECQLKNVSYQHDIVCPFCTGFKDKSKEKGSAACVQSQFPCVQLTVIYRIGEMTREALLHPDSLQAMGPYSQCSYNVCLRTKEENQRAVDVFVQGWISRRGDNKRFACYYNTRESRSVIAQKTYTTSDVIHAMLWPSLVVVACGIIFLRLEMQRRRLTLCGRRPLSDDELVRNGGTTGAGGGGAGLPSHHDGAVGSANRNSTQGSFSSPRRRMFDMMQLDEYGSGGGAAADVRRQLLIGGGAAGCYDSGEYSRAGERGYVYKSMPSLRETLELGHSCEESVTTPVSAMTTTVMTPTRVGPTAPVHMPSSAARIKSHRRMNERSVSVDRYTTKDVLL